MEQIFFDNWNSLIRTAVITVMAYFLLIVLLRTSGKRTLSKMNAFDFIVTIALGSTLATVSLNKSVALADGLLSFLLLIYLQYGISWLSVRNKTVSSLVKATPTLLVFKGRLLREAMRKARIDEDEIYSVVRKKGLSALKEADAIVLETDGTLTLIPKVENFKSPVMESLRSPAGEG